MEPTKIPCLEKGISAGLWVDLESSWASAHGPAAGADLGDGGISFVGILILYELWAGERLVLEKASPRYRRPGRPISVSAVPFGPGSDMWRSCRFLGALFRAVHALFVGIGRFYPL